MIQYELRTIQHGPEHVGQGLLLVLGGAAVVDVLHQALALLRPRLARQRRQEERLDLAGRVEERRLGDGGQRLAALEAGDVGDELAVHQGQSLRDRGVILGALLLGGELRHEDGTRRLDVVEPLVGRRRVAVAGRLHDAVVELLRRQPLHRHAGELANVLLAGISSGAGELVGPGQRDGADQELQVEVVGRELAGQVVEDLGVRRLVLVVEVIDWLDDAQAEKVRPHAVGSRPREVGIVRGSHPVGEGDARADLVLPARLAAVEEVGLDNALGAGDGHLAAVEDLADGAVEALSARPLEAGVEGGQAPELLALPARERVVVALGALQPRPEEQPRRRGRQVLRLALAGHVEGDRRGVVLVLHVLVSLHCVLAGAERQRDEPANDLVVADILLELLPQPQLEARLKIAQLVVGVALGQEQIAPDVRHVGDVAGPLEEVFDQPLPLVGGGVLEEAARLGHRRDLAREVEVDAADELGVVGQRRRRHLVLLLAQGEGAIDPLGQRPGVADVVLRRSGPGGGKQRGPGRGVPTVIDT